MRIRPKKLPISVYTVNIGDDGKCSLVLFLVYLTNLNGGRLRTEFLGGIVNEGCIPFRIDFIFVFVSGTKRGEKQKRGTHKTREKVLTGWNVDCY